MCWYQLYQKINASKDRKPFHIDFSQFNVIATSSTHSYPGILSVTQGIEVTVPTKYNHHGSDPSEGAIARNDHAATHR